MTGSWPLFVRKFVVDFVETGLAAVLALSLVFPASVASAQQEALVIGVALVGAAVSAVRREAPDFIGWLTSKMGVQTSTAVNPLDKTNG